MPVAKLTPADADAIAHTTTLNGKTYRYLLAEPKESPFKATIFLIHGFPDCSFGWRYQIPALVGLGLRVVVPDMIGYGGTDAPRVPPNDIQLYTYRSISDDLAALAKELNTPSIILGGHDWGGMVVYRFAQWYPDLVSHVFSICTPFFPTRDSYVPVEYMVKALPQLGYQLQLGGPDVENTIKTTADLEQVLRGIYGGRTADGKPFVVPETGLDLAAIGSIGKSPLLDDDEFAHVLGLFSRTGFHGPLNWYRTSKANFEADKSLQRKTVEQPVLFILATKDDILTPALAASLMPLIPQLTSREVATNHWALWQDPEGVNRHIAEWLEGVVFAGKSRL